MNVLKHIEVVVPARDEENHIGACLRSLYAAAARLRCDQREVTCGVTVVLDCCTDQTATVAAAFNARTVVSTAGRVGGARRLGVADAIRRARVAGVPAESLWLANTDADSVVPETWLSLQTHYADTGIDAVLGTVTPEGLDPAIDRAWRQRHRLNEGHVHVHGANLGVRASAYQAAGGFADCAVGEDRDLVERITTVTDAWVATHQTSVTTSARLHSRVDGGFASYVAGLSAGDTTCA